MGTAESDEPQVHHLGKGARLWVVGSGDRVLVLHGWGLRPEVYLRSLAELSKRGFTVAAPTLAVVGRRWDADRAVHRATKALDHLGWKDSIVVGNSLGGAVAIHLAAAHPDRVRLLGLVNSLGLEVGHGPLGWVLPFRRYARSANLRALGAFGRNALGGRGVRNLADAARYARRAALETEVEDVHRHGVPSVVLWGEEDRLLPLEMGRRLARTLDAPIRIVPGADHDWTIRHPELFARELAIALRSLLHEKSGLRSLPREEGRGGAGPIERIAGRLRAARAQPHNEPLP